HVGDRRQTVHVATITSCWTLSSGRTFLTMCVDRGKFGSAFEQGQDLLDTKGIAVYRLQRAKYFLIEDQILGIIDLQAELLSSPTPRRKQVERLVSPRILVEVERNVLADCWVGNFAFDTHQLIKGKDLNIDARWPSQYVATIGDDINLVRKE